MVVALEPIRKAFGLERVIVSTYQAVSGAGAQAIEELNEQTKAVLEGSAGPVLCYCRSGTRSTTLWALSQAGKMPASEIIAAAAHAGYDMSHLSGYLGQT